MAAIAAEDKAANLSLNIIRDLENSVENWSYKKLNETDKISSYIKEHLKNYDFS